MIRKSNAEALIGMIAENLTDFIAGDLPGGGYDLSLLFCRPATYECDNGDAPDAACRACVERWLRASYTGEFDFREGRIERVDP